MTKAYQNILLPEVLGREKLKKIRDSLSKDKKQQLDFKISAIISRYKNNSSKVATALAIAETINEGGEIDGLLTTGLLPSLVPIVFAAKHGWTDLVKFLVDSGADIDNIDFNNGRTALIYAAENGHAETVRVLLELGADIEAIDSYRNTALDYAFSNIIIVLASSTKKYHIKNNLGESVWESILKKINLSRNNARIAYIDRLNKKMAIFLAAIVPEMDRTAGNYNQNNDLRRKIIEQFSAENPNRLNPTNNDNRLNEKDLELIDELTELRKINLDYFTNKENSYKQKEFTAEEAIAKANKRVYDVIKINSDRELESWEKDDLTLNLRELRQALIEAFCGESPQDEEKCEAAKNKANKVIIFLLTRENLKEISRYSQISKDAPKHAVEEAPINLIIRELKISIDTFFAGSKDLSNDDNMIAAQVTMRFLKDKKNVMNEFKERKLMAMEDRDAPSGNVENAASSVLGATGRGI